MSKLVLIVSLCFVWLCTLGVVTLEVLGIVGAVGFKGPLPTWGDVAEQVVLGLLLSAALLAFYKFKARKRRDAGV